MKLSTAIKRALRHPGMARRAAMGVVRAQYYRLKFKLLRRRVIIGRNFKVYGPLDIQGPGTVIFGDDCSVIGSRLHPVTPYTISRDAVIRFGNRVVLLGTRLGCQELIDVGDDAGLSEARVMDTDFHQVEVYGTHRSKTSGTARPVIIGRNTWVAAAAIVLKGVRIGENSVVGAGAVVAHKVPPNVVVFGNPARVVWRFRGPPTGPGEGGAALAAAGVTAAEPPAARPTGGSRPVKANPI